MDIKDAIAAAQKQFNEQLAKVTSSRKKPVIMVCGYTGSGKTTLIQTILGKEVVPDTAISHGKPGTAGFVKYTDDYITLIDSRGLEPGIAEEAFIKTAQEEVEKRQQDDNAQGYIHIVWYCIQGCGARVTPADIRLIKDIFPYGIVQVVITKNDITEQDQREALLEALKRGGVPKEKVVFFSKKEKNGQEELVRRSLDLLEEAYRNAFIGKQKVDLARKQNMAMEVIENHRAAAILFGLNPIPLADILSLVPLQVNLLIKLADIYGLSSENTVTRFGAAIAIISESLLVSSVTDGIPIARIYLSAVSAGAITGAIGHLTNEYLVRCSTNIIEGSSDDIPLFDLTVETITRAAKAVINEKGYNPLKWFSKEQLMRVYKVISAGGILQKLIPPEKVEMTLKELESKQT